jgi:Fe2+ transport system protein FeoA
MKLLSEIQLKRKAKIVKVDDDFLNLQLIAKGLKLGSVIEVSRKTFWGNSMYLRCASHSIAIQKKIAKRIYVVEL